MYEVFTLCHLVNSLYEEFKTTPLQKLLLFLFLLGRVANSKLFVFLYGARLFYRQTLK